MIINKYGDHLPLYRQQQVFARSDVGLPVSSMADMVGAAGAALSPLAALLHRELINRPVVHADETTLKILNTKKGGKSCSGYLWAYVSGERTGPSVVCFDCRTDVAMSILKTGFRAGAGRWLSTDIKLTGLWQTKCRRSRWPDAGPMPAGLRRPV